MSVNKISVLGAGSWGTTFAKVIADCSEETKTNHHISLWARRQNVADEINQDHLNTDYTKDIALPEAITATTDLTESVTDADIVVLAIPAQALRPYLSEIKPILGASTLVVSLIKGLERETGLRMSQVIGAELGIEEDRIVVVSGPNLSTGTASAPSWCATWMPVTTRRCRESSPSSRSRW